MNKGNAQAYDDWRRQRAADWAGNRVTRPAQVRNRFLLPTMGIFAENRLFAESDKTLARMFPVKR